MNAIERILSRPVAKPYRSGKISRDELPYINKDGHLDFSPNDIENPKNWSTARRGYVTFVAVLLVVNATFASSSPSGCLTGIAEEFHVSTEAAGLVITLFLLGYCFGPLFWAPLSEFFGRRYIFYITFILYIAFNFLCAWAPNFGSLLVGRFLTGTMVSAPLSNAPGVLADLWGPVERGNAMALFSLMTFAGPALGPVLGGLMQLKENWRWSFYILLMMAGGTLILMLTIPETLPSRVLINKARRIRALKISGYENVQTPLEATNPSLAKNFRIALVRPWIILFDPISFLVAVYLSIVYCLLYMLFSIYPIVFQEMRGWNSFVGELPLLGTVVGAALGAFIFLLFSQRDARRWKTGWRPKPEDRLIPGMIGGIGFSITMFWFAWTANYNSIHWAVPTVAGVFLSTSILLIFVSFLNYLTDTYLMYAASAIAANTVARSACGAAAPLFTNQMFSAMGIGGGGSLVGGVAALLAVIPFAFYKYGGPIRKRSKFAPTPDKTAPNDEESGGQEKPEDEDETQSVISHSDSSSTISDTESTASHSDVHQNAFGQPRAQNASFGKEEV